jgi:hypothetical protein
MRALKLIAGKTARKRIADEGLSPDLVRMVLGASGGPKWLVLMGLDKFIFGHWLADALHKIDLVGSSIGAWRMAGAAHPEPAKALERFHQLYFQFKKADAASPEALTKASYKFLDDLFGDTEAARIVANSRRNLNIVTVRSKGLDASSSKWKEGAGILASAGANAVDRAYLAKFFDRVVFHSGSRVACPDAWPDFERTDVKLQAGTLADVLMATGSIPFVADPITDIAGAPAGVYRDGGVIDYHFDVPWRLDVGIVLYPHFYGHIVPGWFDKKRKARRAKGATWDHMLMLAPTDEFVASLPGGKIPERSNFADMTDAERLAYWTVVTGESKRLADEFTECLGSEGLLQDRLIDAPK